MEPEAMRDYCLAKPGAWPDNPWEQDHPVIKVGEGAAGKIFAFLGDGGVGVKGGPSREAADEWLDRFPGAATVMAYIGRSGWNDLSFSGEIPDDELLEAVSPDTDAFVLASAALHAPFYFFVSYGMIRYLFHDDRVTRDELFATGAAFTVVAWGFTYVFAAAQVVWPGSFGPDRSWFELLFLSFTTLTSVGLSDITPVLPHARSLVIVEQVAGVFYVALVVSRLVGLTVARRARD